MSFCKWIVEQSLGAIVRKQILLRAMKDRKLWRDVIAYSIQKNSTSEYKNCLGVSILACGY